jgi:hypothetical protein
MAKTIDPSYVKYLYMDGIALLSGYSLSISAADDTFFVANNVGVTLYYNNGSRNFVPLAVKRGTIKSEDGTILNELEIGLDNADLAFKNDVMLGRYTNRKCKVLMIFAPKGVPGVLTNVTALGYMHLFTGFLDEPKGDDHWVTFTLRPNAIFEREFPNRIFQVGCNWTFCDNNCAYQKFATMRLELFRYDGTLGSTSDGTTFVLSHGKASNYFVPGFVEILSGDYINFYRPVLANDANSVTCRIPFPALIPAGTSVRVQKLCARNPAACIKVFDNYVNYGGYPHVPKAPLI